jgi:hypothetical protein
MSLILFALALLGYVILRGQGQPMLARGDWRTGAGLLAIGAFAAAAFLAIKTDWPEAFALLVIGCALLLGARSQRKLEPKPRPRPQPPRSSERMTLSEARSIMGVEEGATVEEIRIAYARLMRQAHPDHGGTDGLAAQLNAARDRLLGRRL